MLAIYQINTDGISEGNVINNPFEIEIPLINHYSENEVSFTSISPRTKTSSGNYCSNDQVPDKINYSLQSLSVSSNTVLKNTIESTLDEVYGVGNWEKL